MNAPLAQGSTEWFEARANLLTASICAAALNESTYMTLDDLVHEKVLEREGHPRTFQGNEATRWGTRKEDTGAAWLEKEINALIRGAPLIVHPDHPWLGASSDGLVNDDTGVEIKCPFDKRFLDWENGTGNQDELLRICEHKMFSIADRKDYWIQCQIQMACADLQQVFFTVWTPLIQKYETVERDQEWIDQAIPQLKAVHDRIEAERADPDMLAKHLEGTQSHTQDADVLHIAEMYALQYDRTKQMQEQLERIKQRLISACVAADEDDVETGYLKAKRSFRKGRLNSTQLQKAAKEKGIDIEQFRGEEEEYWSITMKPKKAE